MFFAGFLVTAPHDRSLHVSGWDSWLSSCPNLAPKGWGYKESSNTCNMFAYWDNVYMLYMLKYYQKNGQNGRSYLGKVTIYVLSLYIYIYGTCLFLSMGFNPVKEDPFQSKQASLGFQVYLWNLLIGGKCLLFLFSNLLHARRKIHGGNYHFRDAISHCAEYVNTS